MSVDQSSFKTPGQLIEALLRDRQWTKRTLSIVLDIPEPKVNRLTSGRQPISADVALLLEDVFGVDAGTFLSLQSAYDLAKARLTATADPKRATRAQLFHGLPVADMIRRGWIRAADVRDPRVEPELARFFNANRVEDIEVMPHAAKKTNVNEIASPVQLAWLYRVKQIAREMLVSRFAPEGAATAALKLHELLASAEGVRHVPRILAEAGIRFLIVETLPSAKVDGVCFWLDSKSPVIAVSIRFDRIDNFWFVVRHELEHVIQQHGITTMMLDAELEGTRAGTGSEIADEERVANRAASEFCVPQKMMEAFVVSKAPIFAERDIIGFSNMIKVHPGLVAGQIRYKTNRYDRLGNHLVKVRHLIAPSAVVDGWGDVYPISD